MLRTQEKPANLQDFDSRFALGEDTKFAASLEILRKNQTVGSRGIGCARDHDGFKTTDMSKGKSPSLGNGFAAKKIFFPPIDVADRVLGQTEDSTNFAVSQIQYPRSAEFHGHEHTRQSLAFREIKIPHMRQRFFERCLWCHGGIG